VHTGVRPGREKQIFIYIRPVLRASQENTSRPLFFLMTISQLQLIHGDQHCFETESITRSFSHWTRSEFTNRAFHVR
jgi:hypothetical protein